VSDARFISFGLQRDPKAGVLASATAADTFRVEPEAVQLAVPPRADLFSAAPAPSAPDSRAGVTTGPLSPLVPLGQAPIPAPPPKARAEVTPKAVAYAVVAALSLGFLFRFPTPVMFVLPFGGMAVVVAAKWRWGRHIAVTLFLSAFLAQATSIFVTPFTWWLRFIFFLTLVGSLLLLVVWQTKEL
jgi:hypothetical protein